MTPQAVEHQSAAAPGDTLMNAKSVRAHFDNISEMTLWRWVNDEALGFPAPIYVGRLRYWRARDIKAFEARLAERRQGVQ